MTTVRICRFLGALFLTVAVFIATRGTQPHAVLVIAALVVAFPGLLLLSPQRKRRLQTVRAFEAKPYPNGLAE